jgi:uncharacterized membrane protein
MQDWTIAEALTFAWEKFLANAGVLVAVVLIGAIAGACAGAPGAIVQTAAQLATAEMDDPDQATTITLVATGVRAIFQLLSVVVQAYITLATARVALKIVRDEAVSVADMIVPAGMFGKGLVAGVLSYMATVFGLLFCFVPGIVIAMGFFFSQFVVVDRELGPIDALAESWRLTDGEKLSLLGFGLVCGAIMLVGVLACCVGTFAAAPVVALASAYVYEALLRKKGGGTPARSTGAAYSI